MVYFPIPDCGIPYENDLVGTRCSASGLGIRLRTRGSASLPLRLFTTFQLNSEMLGSARSPMFVGNPVIFIFFIFAASAVRNARMFSLLLGTLYIPPG